MCALLIYRQQKGIVTPPGPPPSNADELTPEELVFERLLHSTHIAKEDMTTALVDKIYQRGTTEEWSDIWEDIYADDQPSQHAYVPTPTRAKRVPKKVDADPPTPSTKAPSPSSVLEIIDLESQATEPVPSPKAAIPAEAPAAANSLGNSMDAAATGSPKTNALVAAKASPPTSTHATQQANVVPPVASPETERETAPVTRRVTWAMDNKTLPEQTLPNPTLPARRDIPKQEVANESEAPAIAIAEGAT